MPVKGGNLAPKVLLYLSSFIMLEVFPVETQLPSSSSSVDEESVLTYLASLLRVLEVK